MMSSHDYCERLLSPRSRPRARIGRADPWCWRAALRSRRAHSVQLLSERGGDETQAVARLTEGIEPRAARAALVRCLSGELASSAAIAQLLYLTGSAASVHNIVDAVTRNAVLESRSGDRLLQDRVDDLTQVAVDPELGVDRLEALQRKDGT